MKENKTIYASPSVKVVKMAARCGIMTVSNENGMDMTLDSEVEW